MNKLLTIGIPTFNRAQLLEKQLNWLARAIKGYESECEIIISDNCSTDNTWKVIKKWGTAFSQATLKLNRNKSNIGAVRNIAYCINTANGTYVWTISDDDLIYEHSLAYIVKTLKTYPELGLLILNFSKRHVKTNQLIFERCFTVGDDSVSKGKAIFEKCLEERSGAGVALTTALVYQTDLVQRAIEEWSSGLDNLLVQLYWTGFCAFHASAMVTKGSYLECNSGSHYFTENKKLLLTLRYADAPEVFVKLTELGYSGRLCQQLILKRFPINNPKLFISVFYQSSNIALHVLFRWFVSVMYVTWRLF